ncbi:MAG: TIGR03118 family protein [Pseudomonadota bacterium]|nr:TIGR03118 family protein [Pseudomonadota bacterium]
MISRALPVFALAALTLVSTAAVAEGPESRYLVTDLVANRPGVSSNSAVTIDPKLVNPWGLAFGTGPVWTANNGSASSSLYDGHGRYFTEFATPANPTGIVWNGNARLFNIPSAPGASTLVPAAFVFAHESGEISAWSGGLSKVGSAVSVWPADPAVSYKGLAIGSNGSGTYLYAADFKGGKVDVYDASFHPAKLACRFQDSLLPAGYAPFGIQNVAGDIVVAYAMQADANGNEAHGAGLGRVDIFTADGCLSRRLVDAGWLDAPWGIALAPASFGRHRGQLLIGNFGSGWIAAFDFNSGEFEGYLKDAEDHPITIGGLWAISFGNGSAAQPSNVLFYAAGANQEADGIYGRIDALPAAR